MKTNYQYGQTAVNMLRELQRNNRLLDNPFDEESKRKVVEETRALFEKIEQDTKKYADKLQRPEVQTALLTFHRTILRNKQCVLAYIMERARLVKELRWQLGSELIPPEVEVFLSPAEKRFRTRYNALLRDYMRSVDLDLTTDLSHPPMELSLNVKVLKDYGQIETSTGPITLIRGNTVTMRRVDAEDLIKRGIVEHVLPEKF